MLKGFETLLALLLALNNTDPAMDRHWKRVTGAAVSVMLLVWLAFGFWFHGWRPNVALAGEVQNTTDKLQRSQDRLALVIVRAAWRSTLRDRCVAVQRRNQEALDAANLVLDDLTDQFRQLATRPPQIPGCDVVLIEPQLQQAPVP